VRGRPDERDAVGLAEPGEHRVLGEEAPAGMQRGAVGLARRLDHARGIEVALRRAGRAEQHGLAVLHPRCVAIGLGDGEHRRDAELVARARDTNGHLATIRDEQAPERRSGLGHRAGR